MHTQGDYSLPGLPGTAQRPQPHLLAPSRCPHSAGNTPWYPKGIPQLQPPQHSLLYLWGTSASPQLCTSGERVHRPSSALTPSEPSSPAPQSHTAIPKMHRGRGGHTSTLTTPALLAALPYTASTCTAATRVQGRRPRLCPLLQAPAPINIQ